MYNNQQPPPYSVTPTPMSQQFCQPQVFHPPHIHPTSGNIQMVGTAPNIQQLYIPVQPIPVISYPNAVQRRVINDPERVMEEQRKFEKERNFQLQQQRLKQFTVAGKKGSMNADNLLGSMFGKPESKKGVSSKVGRAEDEKAKLKCYPTAPATSVPKETAKPTKVAKDYEQPKTPTRRDPKVLENMMLQCSNLTGPQKAKPFQKPMLKSPPKSADSGKTFAASEKAVDWNRIQGLENVFTAPQSRFPLWCKKELVPVVYQDVEKIVTDCGSHEPHTSLLLPILVSSGLPQKLLSDIWEYANQTLPGSLTCEEMYAALAMIAVAQAGHQFKSADILHQLPHCPVPVLHCFSPTSEAKAVVPNEDTPESSTSDSNQTEGKSSTDAKRRTMFLPSSVDFSKLKSPSTDDDFDDFKSATPMAINAPTIIGGCDSATDDDFSDFQQAGPPPVVALDKTPQSVKYQFPMPKPKPMEEDLLSNEEDKYSVFRLIQSQDVDASSFSSSREISKESPDSVLSSHSGEEDLLEHSSLTPVHAKDDLKNLSVQQSVLQGADSDDFGDFIDAAVAIPPSQSHLSTTDTVQISFATDFADFSKLKDNTATESPSIPITQPNDFDFGEFTSCPSSGEVHDFSHCGLKKNVSCIESQSISSLDLGTFDNESHGGELQSNLSRQGSIPSLDLKTGCSEVVDSFIDFGEMQSSTPRTCVSPSPSVETNKSTDEKPSFSSSSFAFTQPPPFTVPLTDKYSVIRSEQICHGDEHASEWVKCLQSCLNILQNATRIFNQMSCSSVCNEVLAAEEGKNYIKSVIEVYRVVCRVSLASKYYEKQNDDLVKLVDRANQAFHSFTIFLSGSSLMPNDASLDFSLGILKPHVENGEKACGVCLLNVDSRSKAFNKGEDIHKLFYGGRHYHSTCANLWVNCVDPLLPVLTLPQLL